MTAALHIAASILFPLAFSLSLAVIVPGVATALRIVIRGHR